LAFESHRAPQQSRKPGKSNRKRVRTSHLAIFLREAKSADVLPIRASAPSTLSGNGSACEQNESGSGADALKAGKAEIFREQGPKGGGYGGFGLTHPSMLAGIPRKGRAG
jgi:hypothetical protein